MSIYLVRKPESENYRGEKIRAVEYGYFDNKEAVEQALEFIEGVVEVLEIPVYSEFNETSPRVTPVKAYGSYTDMGGKYHTGWLR